MSFLGLTGLINLVTSFILGIVYLFQIPQKGLRNTAFIANMSIAVFSLGYFEWQNAADINTALFWFKILFVGIVLINSVFVHFVFVFVGVADKKKPEIIINYLLSALFIYLNFTMKLYTGLEPRFGLGLWPVPTFAFSMYLVFWWWQCLYGCKWLITGLKNSRGYQLEQIKYFALGLVAAFMGGASNWPMWYSINFPPYMNLLISLYVVLASYAIIKYRLMDITIVLTRAGIFLILYTFILGVPLLLGYKNGFGMSAFIVLFVLATIGPVIYQILQRKADDMILSKQRTYQDIFLQSSREFLRERDLNRIVRLIVYGVKYQINVAFAALFLIDRETGVYRLEFIRGDNTYPQDYYLKPTDPLITLLNIKRQVLTFQEIPASVHRFTPSQVQIIVPSFLDDNLLGFLMMGEKMNRSFFSNEDIYTFEVIAHQAALAIENCLYMEEKEKVQERLFQTEKSASIGGMAEGVAHQINNRLNQFSFSSVEISIILNKFKTNAPAELIEKKETQDFISELEQIQDQIIDNVKRTDNVIKGILNYAGLIKREDYPKEFFFDEIIKAAIDFAKVKHEIEEFPISIDVIGTSNIIYGKMTQILETLFILVDNAHDAIEEKRRFLDRQENPEPFEPHISIQLVQEENLSHIEITDNGIGIREEDRNKVFAPYFTTKSSYNESSGSGIGLYEVSRFVNEHHRGRIWFTSEYMKGTTFNIELPRHPAENEAAV